MNSNTREKVLVLGATGMLGHTTLRYFVDRNKYPAVGSVRSEAAVSLLPRALRENICVGVDVEKFDSLTKVFADVRPQVVINCIGLVKQLAQADDPLVALPINSLLPHRLAQLCAVSNARLIHISTDCVFSGNKGMYREEDPSDASDLYGRSKFLGEVDYLHAVTLRTSILGPELNSSHGLLGWFLSEQTEVLGYRKAIFSGLTTVELARVMHDFVIPNANIRGVYHVSTDAIDKYALLQHVAEVYRAKTAIRPDDKLVIDRSLDSTRFKSLTAYKPPTWPQLITQMRDFG
jgi:dTDP-4-dehydrorhamnose reductase